MAILSPRGHDDEFVFGLAPDTPLVAFGRTKKQLDARCGVTGWTFHDLRRTARTLMSRAGKFIDEKRHAFEALAHQIDLIVNPPMGNITPMRRKACRSYTP